MTPFSEQTSSSQLMLSFGEWLQGWADFAQHQATLWVSADASATDDDPPLHWQNLVADDAPPAHWLAMLEQNGVDWPGHDGGQPQPQAAAWHLDGEPLDGRLLHLWLPLFEEGLTFFSQQLGFALGGTENGRFDSPEAVIQPPSAQVAEQSLSTSNEPTQLAPERIQQPPAVAIEDPAPFEDVAELSGRAVTAGEEGRVSQRRLAPDRVEEKDSLSSPRGPERLEPLAAEQHEIVKKGISLNYGSEMRGGLMDTAISPRPSANLPARQQSGATEAARQQAQRRTAVMLPIAPQVTPSPRMRQEASEHRPPPTQGQTAVDTATAIPTSHTASRLMGSDAITEIKQQPNEAALTPQRPTTTPSSPPKTANSEGSANGLEALLDHQGTRQTRMLPQPVANVSPPPATVMPTNPAPTQTASFEVRPQPETAPVVAMSEPSGQVSVVGDNLPQMVRTAPGLPQQRPTTASTPSQQTTVVSPQPVAEMQPPLRQRQTAVMLPITPRRSASSAQRGQMNRLGKQRKSSAATASASVAQKVEQTSRQLQGNGRSGSTEQPPSKTVAQRLSAKPMPDEMAERQSGQLPIQRRAVLQEHVAASSPQMVLEESYDVSTRPKLVAWAVLQSKQRQQAVEPPQAALPELPERRRGERPFVPHSPKPTANRRPQRGAAFNGGLPTATLPTATLPTAAPRPHEASLNTTRPLAVSKPTATPFAWPPLPQHDTPADLGRKQRQDSGRRQRLNREQRGR
ncbi:MAG: hypothetical protein AAF614_08025 [Chloroflexota bacterium]